MFTFQMDIELHMPIPFTVSVPTVTVHKKHVYNKWGSVGHET